MIASFISQAATVSIFYRIVKICGASPDMAIVVCCYKLHLAEWLRRSWSPLSRECKSLTMVVIRRSKISVWTRRKTILACAVAFTAEEADKVLLTSMYLAIGNSLQALPSQLGQLTMWRALVQVWLLFAVWGMHCSGL